MSTTDGINLSAPHGELIWQGKKSVIVKHRQFPELLGRHILVSDSKAWGEIEVGGEQSLSATEFDEHFSEHRVTKKEREKWWPDVDTLYLYPVVSFAPYDRPRSVNVPNGAKTLIEEVQFKEDDGMPYSMDNLPRPAKNWPKEAQRKCYRAANAVLRDGGSEQDAIFACIHAAGMTQHPGGEDNKEVAFSETDYAIAEGIVGALMDTSATEQKAETPPLVAEPLQEQKETEPEAVRPNNEEKSSVPEQVETPEVEDTKIGKRFSAHVMKIFQDLKDAIDGLIRHGNYEEEEEEEKGVAFKTVEHKGKTYLIVWPTNAFQDKELEIFSTKAIADYVERHSGDADKGELRYRHWRGTKFGTIAWQGMSGRFLMEVATFDDTPIGQAFKSVLTTYPDGHPDVSPEGWGTSHGYKYREEDRGDGIYEWFDKWETSVLPAHLAANPHNPSMEVVTMDKKAIDELSALVGEEIAKQAAELGERLTREKEEAGIAHKEADVYEEDVEMDVKERWDTAYVNDLPDSAFLYIAPGGKKDEEGKTVPRNLRKLPYKDKGGNIDLPHLRNAISRLGQPKTDIPADVKKRLQKKAQGLLAEHGGGGGKKEEPTPIPEPEPAPTTPETSATETEEEAKEPTEVTEVVAAVMKELHLDELATAFKSLTETNASLTKELEEVKTRLAEVERDDTERIAEKEASLPAWPWSRAFRPSQAESTKLGDDDALKAKLPKNPPPAVAGIAAAMGGN